MSFTLTSSAFADNEIIPPQYTCDGDNINPPLSINGVPEGTKSLVLVMDDPDIPEEVKVSRGIEKFDHWVIYNLPADAREVEAGASPGSAGINTAGQPSYTGPCPPADMEPREHRYIFRLYAISEELNFIKTPTLDEVEEAVKGMTLDSATLVGRYSRQ